jgi:hypothetical protein
MQKQGPKAVLYKACPRCRGDLVLDPEEESRLILDHRLEYVCLQCGRRTSVEPPSFARATVGASYAA